MSSIFGGISKRSALPADCLAQMSAALAAVRSTRYGHWSDSQVALGHLLVPTTPEALREQQPEQQGELRAVFDSRVDNRNQLLASLDRQLDLTDSALFLAAYQRWERQAFLQIYGDFAAAIWDPATQSLTLARDPIGCKPLYFCDCDDWLLFASNPKALLAIPGVSREVDPRLLAHQSLNCDDLIGEGATAYRSIRFLKPGHILSCGNGETRVCCYWKPQDFPEKSWTAEQLDQAPLRLRELMESAVSSRLRTTQRVGAHLSGGLDSSSIAVLASRQLKQIGAAPPITVSWSPSQDQANCHDHQWIEDIVNSETVEHFFCPLDAQACKEFLKHTLALGALHPLLAEIAPAKVFQEHGCRVVLSGWGGDQVASHDGTGHFFQLFTSMQWLRLYRQLKELLKPRGVPVWRGFYLYGFFPLLPHWVLRLMNRLRPGVYLRPKNIALIDSLQDILPLQEREALAALGGLAGLQSSWQFRVLTLTMSNLAARMSGWANLGDQLGLEYRYPLLDRRILEFGLSLPGEAFVRQGLNRHLFRVATAPWLPDSSRFNRIKSEPVNANRLLETFKTILEGDASELPPETVQSLRWMKLAMDGFKTP